MGCGASKTSVVEDIVDPSAAKSPPLSPAKLPSVDYSVPGGPARSVDSPVSPAAADGVAVDSNVPIASGCPIEIFKAAREEQPDGTCARSAFVRRSPVAHVRIELRMCARTRIRIIWGPDPVAAWRGVAYQAVE